MNRHRELLDAERAVLREMANGVVGGRYTYWCRNGEVNLKLCSQYETLFFTSVFTEQQRHCGIYSSIVL